MSRRRPAKATWGGAPGGASNPDRPRLVRIGPAANDNRRAWALRVAGLVAALGVAIWALVRN
jgi:hypothetical protein